MSRNTNTTPTINIDKTGVSHNKEDMTEFMLTGLRNRAGNGGGVYYGPKPPVKGPQQQRCKRHELSLY